MVLAFLRIAAAASRAYAVADCGKPLCVEIGTVLDSDQIAQSIINFLATSIGFVTVAVFIFGALKLTASGVNEEWRNQGKDLMIKSLIAMVIVLGAYAILRTVMFFILAP